MATLRNSIGVNTDSGLAARLQDQDIANGMNEVERGWASGRINNDANALAAEEVSRRVNDPAGADTLRGQIGALQERQQMYAPSVGRVEDIDWSPGKAASWLGGQVGQGAASMTDPVAASAAIGGATKLAGMLPGGIGRGAKLLGGLATAAVPFAMNQRQMTGEFVNDAVRDPELMARTSPTELRNAANLYGVGAGALDTILPHMVGKQLVGGGLRAGLSSTGPLAKTAGGMLLEGGTEFAQGKASQFTQGVLNPERDTAGDFSDDINNFAGGAAGGSPFAAAGAYADAGYRRVGDTAEKLGTAAGQGFDLAADAAGQGYDKAKDAASPYIDKVRGLFGSAKQTTTDLLADEDGKISAQSMLDNFKTGGQEMAANVKNSIDEQKILNDAPNDLAVSNDTAKLEAWLVANGPKRDALVISKLQGLAENDDQAHALLTKISEQVADPAQANDAAASITEGANYLLAASPTGRLHEQASKLGSFAGAVGSALASGAQTLGKVAMGAGKALVAGAKEGASKKNMQSNEPAEEGFAAWRDRVYETNGQKVVAHELAKGKAHVLQAEAEQRAELAGSYAADMAKRAWPKDRSLQTLMRRSAYAIADMSETWSTDSSAREGREPAEVLRLGGREAKLNRIVDVLRQGYKENAPSVLESIGQIMGTRANGIVEYMRGELEQQMAPKGKMRTDQLRAQLAKDMVNLIGGAERQKLMDQEVNMYEPTQALYALGRMEDYADGIGTEKGNTERRALDSLFGKESVDRMLTLLNGLPEKGQVGSVVDDRSQAAAQDLDPNADDAEAGEDTGSYEQVTQEKNVRNSAEKTVYGFQAEKQGRVGDTRHPFYPTEKLSKKDLAEREAAGDDTEKRPSLFRTGQVEFSHKDPVTKANVYEPAELESTDELGRVTKTSNLAIDKRVKALGDEMGVQRDEDGNPTSHAIGAKTAHEVMKSLNLQPGAILALHRDYLKKDATLKSEQYPTTPAERTALEAQSARVSRLLGKMVRSAKGLGEEAGRKMTIAERKAHSDMVKRMIDKGADATMTVDEYQVKEALEAAKAYFSERHMAVANQMTNAVQEKISYTELREMANMGQRTLDVARKNADGDKRLLDLYTSRANVIMFEPLPGKDGKSSPAVAVPAGKLVLWAMQQRSKFQPESKKKDKEKSLSDAQKNAAYRKDVMTAVSSVMDSGLVGKEWPHKLNEGGEMESFVDGIPPSLQLPTSNQSKDESDLAERRAKLQAQHGQADLQKFQGADQDRVSSDQDKNEEHFVSDPYPVNERSGVDLKLGVQRKDNADYYVDPELDTSSRQPTAKTDRDDKTEMDFFPERRPGQERGDFDDQQYRTEQTMEGFELPKSRMAAMSAAKITAGKITKLMMTDPRMARDVIMSHIRMALQAEGFNENGTVGDAYRIAPIIDLVSTENRARFIKHGAPPNLVDGMERAALTVMIRAADGRNEIADDHQTLLAEKLGVPADLKKMQALLAKRGPVDMAKLNAYVSPKNPDPVKGQTRVSAATKPDSTAVSAKAEPAAKEVAAGLGKPSGGVELEASGPYAAKDQAKSDQATKFIGRGSATSSTAKYAKAWGARANTGSYTAADTVFVSAEGNRAARLSPDTAELGKAMAAGTTIVTDVALARNRDWNVGERQVAEHLAKNGYAETQPGRWTPAKVSLAESGGRKLNAMAADIHTSLQRSGFAATHDSPIRHEGKFDWRAHQGKGEGNASFGAGTYLSTSEGVHRAYKEQFTAAAQDAAAGGLAMAPSYIIPGEILTTEYKRQIVSHINADLKFEEAVYAGENDPREQDRLDVNIDWLKHILSLVEKAPVGKPLIDRASKSPTYEVSVDIPHDQLLDWDMKLGNQDPRIEDGVMGAAEEAGLSTQRQSEAESARQNGSTENDWHLADNDSDEPWRDHEIDQGMTGEEIYNEIAKKLGSQAKASDLLQKHGILGHQFASSGGKNRREPNVVVYDDAKISTNYVHFNAQNKANIPVATQAQMDEAQAEADKLFGKGRVNLEFRNITGYSGEYIEGTNTIVIATTAAAGTLGTLYHEALHKFFKDFVRSNPKLQSVFESLVNNDKHLAKLHVLLDGYPAAQAQLTSGEERLAYTYQFWKAGLLQVDAQAVTWMQKVGKFFRRVAGMVRDSERALELFQAFDNGKMSEPSAAGRVIAAALEKGTNTIKARRNLDRLVQRLAALTVPAGEILGQSISPKARALGALMFTNPGDEEHGSVGTGLMNARRNLANQYGNRAKVLIADMDSVDMARVQKYLQDEVKPDTIASPEHRAAVKGIRTLLDEFHGYMVKAGMKIGKIDNYYPTVWNTDALLSKKEEFITMLTMNYGREMAAIKPGVNTALRNLPPGQFSPRDAATRIWQSLVDRGGVDAHLTSNRDDGVLNPFFASQEERTLPWLKGADKEAFLEKDMPMTLTRYFEQGAHATEYFRRFGKDGTRLDDMLNGTKYKAPNGDTLHLEDGILHELRHAATQKIKRGELKDTDASALWVARQMRDISQSVGAMEGSLGKDVSPAMRQFSSWMTVYQNIRLLPMSLFSSFVDPLALVARGAPLQAAYETFIYGMKEVFAGWADAFKDMPAARAKDEWRQLSEHIGASEIAAFSHLVADQYSSNYMTSGARKLNDKMFTLNGMEAWNRGTRVMATKWAVRFLEKHRELPDKIHSARWLKELGLTPDMLTMDDGRLVTNREQLAVLKGITPEVAERELRPVYDALNRWVEGAVLTPNAAQRPAWASDQNYSVMFHLKQFSYSFHQTILKRAVNEFKHGNIAPVGALAMFIPTMITADIMKGLIQGGGELPAYMAGMNAGDWMMHGAQRAGLAGIGVIGVDAGQDLSSLGGPAIEQMVDGLRDGFGNSTIINAAPLHGLYAQALK